MDERALPNGTAMLFLAAGAIGPANPVEATRGTLEQRVDTTPCGGSDAVSLGGGGNLFIENEFCTTGGVVP